MLLNEIKGIADKNSQYGTVWIHRGLENKKIKTDQLQSFLDDGWEQGRQLKAELAPRKKYELQCAKCGVMFLSKVPNRTRCNSCTKSDVGKIPAQRGTHAGWHYRKGEASYPELYFEDVFNKEGITGWIREKKIHRWFIDFAFEDKKIAVEIDGRQHNDPDRIEMDKRKDEFLTSQGWKVIRIKWYNPRTESGKSKLHPQVKSLLDQVR